MPEKPRTIIVGLDGVPFDMLKTLAQSGVMPNTAQLIDRGFFTPMRSSIPEISSVAWSSIVTGTNPAEHGIFGFVDMVPGSYKLSFPNFKDLQAKPFWESCPGQSVIINVPSTYPVRQMNGVHISGFVSIDINKSVHPPSLLGELQKLDYRLDVDSQKAHTDIDAFLEDLDKSLQARIEAYRYLWDTYDFQAFMLVFTGTDRLLHFLYSAYDDPNHAHHDFFLDHFRTIDRAIGEIAGKLTEDDSLIMLSDHGFERLEADIYVNALLAREGYLSFRPNRDPAPAAMDSATRAFALDPARIYLNRKGKYPAGGLADEDAEACLRDLEDLFSSWEIQGRKVVRDIHRKEDVYAGPHLDRASDLILIAEKGFNLKGSMASKDVVSEGPFTGKHSYPDAFLLVGDAEKLGDFPDQPTVTDAGKFIKSRMGQNWTN